MSLHVFADSQELGQAAAELVARLSAEAVSARGRFSVALSGGSLPKLLGPALTAPPLKDQIGWPIWHIFWADERCVPLTHPDSNYLLARQYLFDSLPIPPAQIYPPDTTLPPAQAAAAYESTLAQHFNLQPATYRPTNLPLPVFDLILLGMGEDGHTASLFPDHPLLNETTRWVVPIFDSPKPPPERITLTLPVINQARAVMFLVTGAGKAEALHQALVIKDGSRPAQRIQPTLGELYWLVDQAAAASLPDLT